MEEHWNERKRDGVVRGKGVGGRAVERANPEGSPEEKFHKCISSFVIFEEFF